MVMKKRKPKGNVITVDFTGVKSGGTLPDGRYAAKITAVEQKEGKESGEPYLELTWEITSEKCNGREVKFDNYSLQPQALWRLKSLLEAMDIEVLEDEQDIDLDELVSNETQCIIELTGQKSNDGDRTYARVTGHAPLEDGGTVDDDEEDKTNKSAKDKDESTKRRGKKDKDEDEDEDEDDPPTSPKKIKKGAKVKFRDEKNKLFKGTIESIDKDLATVVTTDDDTYEIDVEELTVIG
jgi:hypothetical protein